VNLSPIIVPMKVAYLDGRRLRRALIAACDYTARQRTDLNRINVFPVPDGDTGTNLALTVRAVAEHLRSGTEPDVGAVAQSAAEAAVLGARGNSGMMLSHFLLGFAARLKGRVRISPSEFSDALEAGVRSLYAAIDRPVEGTILTVMRETAEAAEASADVDFHPYVEMLVQAARASLERTPELLPVLREAGVVDAGAKGFVHLLEGAVAYLVEGERPTARAGGARSGSSDAGTEGLGEDGLEGDDAMAVAHAHLASDETFRYCTEGLVRGDSLPDEETVRGYLRSQGDSIVVIRTDTLLKVHVHTDTPEAVFQWLRTQGTLSAHKAEDMHLQHETLVRAGPSGQARRPLVVLTDSASDLPADIRRAHGIRVIPLYLLEGDTVLRDGVDITAERFHARLEEPGDLPTTSQPPPADFLAAFQDAAQDGEALLYVGISSALSGTLASAQAAGDRYAGDAPLHCFDSRAASLLQGLLTLRAAELSEAGMAPDAILRHLKASRDRSGVFVTVDTFDRLLASGRVGKGKAFMGRLLDVKPILELNDEGRIVQGGKARGREALLATVLERLEKKVVPGRDSVRFGIVHVAIPEIVPQLTAELQARYGASVEIISAPATPVLATHLGTGAWGLIWLVEPDPTA
jgi:DegV family protein with EDD domain